MSLGISSSINLTLARIGSIEGNFQALEGIAQQIDDVQNSQVQEIQKDFKKVLDKVSDTKTPEKEWEKAQELVEEITSDDTTIQNEAQKKEVEEKKEAIELKSKLDLKSQMTDIDEIIQTYSDKYDVDSDFIKAIIKQESGFNKSATSKKGAMGLMQLMPQTAKSLGVIDAYNPSQNIEGGVKHLKNLLNKYDNNRELALAAYNAGEGAVKKYGGIPPYKETQNYVKAIMSSYYKTKEAQI